MKEGLLQERRLSRFGYLQKLPRASAALAPRLWPDNLFMIPKISSLGLHPDPHLVSWTCKSISQDFLLNFPTVVTLVRLMLSVADGSQQSWLVY